MLRRMQYFKYIHIRQHLFQMPHFLDLSVNPFNQIYCLCFRPHSPALPPKPLSYSALVALKATPHKQSVSWEKDCAFLALFTVQCSPYPNTVTYSWKMLSIHWIGFWNSSLWSPVILIDSLLSINILLSSRLSQVPFSGANLYISVWWAQLVRILC